MSEAEGSGPTSPSPRCECSPRYNPYRVVLFAAAVIVVLRYAPRLLPVATVAILAVIFALLLDAPVGALHRRGVPRGVGVLCVLTLLVGGLGVTAALVVPEVRSQLMALEREQGDLTAALLERVNEQLERVPGELAIERADVDGVIANIDVGGIIAAGSSATALVVLALVAAAWAVASPRSLEHRLLGFVPRRRRARTQEVVESVLRRLRRWLLGQLSLNVMVGLSAYVLFRALDVPFALLLAILAGVLESIPTLGIILSSAPPIALTLLVHPQRVILLIIGILVIQQVEDRVVVPAVMKRAVDIPQALLILVFLVFAVMFGPVGALFALPVTVTALAVHDALVGVDEDEEGSEDQRREARERRERWWHRWRGRGERAA